MPRGRCRFRSKGKPAQLRGRGGKQHGGEGDGGLAVGTHEQSLPSSMAPRVLSNGTMVAMSNAPSHLPGMSQDRHDHDGNRRTTASGRRPPGTPGHEVVARRRRPPRCSARQWKADDLTGRGTCHADDIAGACRRAGETGGARRHPARGAPCRPRPRHARRVVPQPSGQGGQGVSRPDVLQSLIATGRRRCQRRLPG